MGRSVPSLVLVPCRSLGVHPSGACRSHPIRWARHHPPSLARRPDVPTRPFVHAADLHLGAPFARIDATDPRPARPPCGTRSSPPRSGARPDRDLCLARTADFLVLAGDVYDAAEKSVHDQAAFRDAMRRLADAGVRAYVAHGNHDPADGWSAGFALPENVHVFSHESVERVVTPATARSSRRSTAAASPPPRGRRGLRRAVPARARRRRPARRRRAAHQRRQRRRPTRTTLRHHRRTRSRRDGLLGARPHPPPGPRARDAAGRLRRLPAGAASRTSRARAGATSWKRGRTASRSASSRSRRSSGRRASWPSPRSRTSTRSASALAALVRRGPARVRRAPRLLRVRSRAARRCTRSSRGRASSATCSRRPRRTSSPRSVAVGRPLRDHTRRLPRGRRRRARRVRRRAGAHAERSRGEPDARARRRRAARRGDRAAGRPSPTIDLDPDTVLGRARDLRSTSCFPEGRDDETAPHRRRPLRRASARRRCPATTSATGSTSSSGRTRRARAASRRSCGTCSTASRTRAAASGRTSRRTAGGSRGSCSTGEEGRAVVERDEGGAGAPESDASTGRRERLERLTRGVPQAVYRNVFGFGLHELSDLTALGDISSASTRRPRD